jgi:hypothetical protein
MTLEFTQIVMSGLVEVRNSFQNSLLLVDELLLVDDLLLVYGSLRLKCARRFRMSSNFFLSDRLTLSCVVFGINNCKHRAETKERSFRKFKIHSTVQTLDHSKVSKTHSVVLLGCFIAV